MNITILSLIALIILSIYALIKAADLIEDSFVYISKKLRISEFFTGFVILAAVSSLPELAIAVNSSNTVPELSVGNLLGATLIMLTLVLGLGTMKFESINFKGRFRRREMFGSMFVILLSILILVDQRVTVIEGVLLIATYIFLLIDIRYQFSKKKPEEENIMVSARKIYVLLTKSLIGIFLLLISSYIAVESVIQLGNQIDLNESLIGLFVLAIGTNTPELALLIRAKNFDQSKLAIGNFIGSAVFNSTTLGVLAILSGGFVINDFISIIPAMVLICFAAILFLFFSYTGKELTKNEGMMLVGAYLSLVITELILITGILG